MSNGSKRKSSLDFDVGLGLKMPTESRPRDGNNAPIFGGSDIYSRSFLNTGYGGGMTGKALFTASQWEELERQNLIHKYIMASIPVPSQLLFPLSTTQSNTSSLLSMDLKYSSSSTTNNGSDAEPWRCKRTDGKKWRCSRDVAPDHKYCERHAHKNKPRSRKLVESQPHTSSTIPTIPTTNPPFDQTRCMEWLMRNGTTSNNQQQWHPQFLQTSSSRLFDRETSDTNKNNVSVFNEDKLQALIGGYNNEPYIPDTSHLHKYETLSTLGSKVANSLQNPEENQTTRRFIDAWDNENKKFYPSSSLTLSMNGIDDHRHNDDNNSGNSYLGSIGMRGNDGIMKFGGPLGEALCLGNAMSTRGNSGNSSLLASPGDHGYSNTNSSSCSKGSCEDGNNNAFNFIG